MAVNINVTEEKIWRAVNTPGGPVYDWRDRTMILCADRAYSKSPVNNPLNARHRGGKVGTFKVGWKTRRTSNQHGCGAVISNIADHAVYVELGRSASGEFQAFSWSKWNGETGYVRAGGPIPNYPLFYGGRGTAARPGKHILAKALAYALARTT